MLILLLLFSMGCSKGPFIPRRRHGENGTLADYLKDPKSYVIFFTAHNMGKWTNIRELFAKFEEINGSYLCHE